MEKELLESWKEISAYLNRNIRTCQYWEKKHGLPIHRLEDSPKARVFAYKKELDRWKQEKLHRGEIVQKNLFLSIFPKYKILSIFIFTFFSLVITTLIILLVFQEKKAPQSPSLKPSVLIIPFYNSSGKESLEHFSFTLSNMLITDLSQSKHVSVFRRDRIFSILLDLDLYKAQSYSSEDLRKVAQAAGASHIIQGSYFKLGEIFRIDVDIIESYSMSSVGTDKFEGKESNLAAMIDELTKKIKLQLKLTDEAIAHDIDERVGEVTTSFPEAYRHYIAGRNFHNLNEYDKSIESMEKALEIDSEFALAYRSISESYYNMGLLSKSREYAEKALKFSDRITERELYHLQIRYYRSSEKTWDKAIDAGLKLIQGYPDDIGGNDLATLYFLLEQWDKAIKFYQVFVQNQEISYFPYMGLASSYEAKGMYKNASGILEDYLHDISEHHSIRWQLAISYLCQERYGLALEEAEKLDPWNSDIKGFISLCRDELDNAEREYLYMLDSRISRDVASGSRLLGSLYTLQGRHNDAEKQLLRGVSFANDIGELSWKHEIHSELAYLYLVSGNPEKALKENNKAFEYAVEEESIRRQVDSLHLGGLIFVDMKLLKDAQKTANKLKNLIDFYSNRKLLRHYYHLIGKIELERKNLPKAIRNFKNATALLPFQYYEWYFRLPLSHALFFDSLALAYFKSGDFERALGEYEKVIHLSIGRLWYGDKYRNGYYMLAKIFEQKGQKAAAAKYYKKFLILLKDADPGLPEVKEAHKRLVALLGPEIRNITQ